MKGDKRMKLIIIIAFISSVLTCFFYIWYRRNLKFNIKDFQLRKDKLDQISYEYEYED